MFDPRSIIPNSILYFPAYEPAWFSYRQSWDLNTIYFIVKAASNCSNARAVPCKMQRTEAILPVTSTVPWHEFGDSFIGKDLVHKIVVTLSAVLSICGTSVIIGTFIAWEDFRSISRKILVYISMADFLTAGGNLLGFWINRAKLSCDKDFLKTLCEGQSFVTSTATLWSFFWTVFLAIFLYMVVVKKQRRIAETSLKIFHFFAWGVPLVLVGTALGLQKLGTRPDNFYTSGWCWVHLNMSSSEQGIWMLLLGKAWEIVAYVLIFVFYFTLKCHIRKVRLFRNSAWIVSNKAMWIICGLPQNAHFLISMQMLMFYIGRMIWWW